MTNEQHEQLIDLINNSKGMFLISGYYHPIYDNLRNFNRIDFESPNSGSDSIETLWFNYNLDISMHLIVNGEEVYSVTAPQKVKDLLWLPLFFTWPIFNHGVVGNHVENKAIDYFISEIIENQLYAYENKESYVEKIYPKIDVNLKR